MRGGPRCTRRSDRARRPERRRGPGVRHRAPGRHLPTGRYAGHRRLRGGRRSPARLEPDQHLDLRAREPRGRHRAGQGPPATPAGRVALRDGPVARPDGQRDGRDDPLRRLAAAARAGEQAPARRRHGCRSLDTDTKYFAVLVALCEPRLRGSSMAAVPSVQEVVARLRGSEQFRRANRSSINYHIDYLADQKSPVGQWAKYDDGGRMHSRREALVAFALRFDLVGEEHLALLPDRIAADPHGDDPGGHGGHGDGQVA
ncbi:hypothetical protein G5V59_10410 [Nocardioides sp. W3-2-3]|nr:hypothetical protein [Nocardioides convexus]